MEGDDATEFLESFAETYENSLDGILWYFHFIGDEPPGHRRVLPVGTEGAIIPSYPITLTHLVAAAETGQWPIKYPAHTVRQSLFSKIMIALFCFSVFAVFAAAAFVTIL